MYSIEASPGRMIPRIDQLILSLPIFTDIASFYKSETEINADDSEMKRGIVEQTVKDVYGYVENWREI